MEWMQGLLTDHAPAIALVEFGVLVVGVLGGFWGWLTMRRHHEELLRRLDERPSRVTINGDVHIGQVVVDRDGLYRTPFEGMGEIVSADPVLANVGEGLGISDSFTVEGGTPVEKTEEE